MADQAVIVMAGEPRRFGGFLIYKVSDRCTEIRVGSRDFKDIAPKAEDNVNVIVEVEGAQDSRRDAVGAGDWSWRKPASAKR